MVFPATPLGVKVELGAIGGVLLTEDFEAGASALNNFDAKSASNLTVEAAAAHNGGFGLDFNLPSTSGFVRWRERLWRNAAAAYPYWSVRFYVRFPSLPSAPPPSIFSCITVGDDDDFTFFYVPATGLWKWDLDILDTASSTRTVEANRWYLIEAKGSYATTVWTADVRINGEDQGSVSTNRGNTEVVHNARWGHSSTGQTWNAEMDDFAMAVASYPLGFLGPPPGVRTWSDVTALALVRDGLTITRGRTGEGAEVDRGTCRVTTNDESHDLAPRNPEGVFYGGIGRNTPLRVRLDPGPAGYLLMYDDGRANTPDSSDLSITGDIDVRLDLKADDWAAAQGLANKLTNPSQRSWVLYLNANGTLSFAWSADGTTLITKTSTAAVTVPASGRLAVRATLDVDNGAAGNTVTFYTAPTIDGTWTQLGSTVVTGGVTSIFNSTANLELGGSQGVGSSDDLTGRIYGFQMYASLTGANLRALVDFSIEEPGPGPFTAGDGLVWTLAADASIVRPDLRFSGEVSEWPTTADPAEADVTVAIEASGILRRLGQGASPLQSTLRRGYSRLSGAAAPVAYWPCEDSEDATSIASALTGHPAMTIQAGANPLPDFASHTGFKCSAPLPTFNGTQWTGIVPTYTATGSIQVFFLASIPSGTTDEEGICAVYTTGTAQLWRILYDSAGSGNLRIIATDAAGTELLNSSIAFNVNNKLIRVDLELVQDGSDVDWALETLEVGASAIGGTSGTVTSATIGRCAAVVMNAGADLTNVAVGHISVHSSVRDLFGLAEELNAYTGEVAGRRAERLCEEEGITFRGEGDLVSTTAMGPQLPGTLLDLLREAALADGGVLYEPRDLAGLGYRTRDSMCAQPSALELDYSDGHVHGLQPTDDDRLVLNDVTVQRVGGSSARAVKETGALSILAPPDGVGRYDTEVTRNLELDSQLPDHAGWLVHLGTVDRQRYPLVALNLRRLAADADIAQAAQELEVGDRLTIDNPGAWLPPEQITQLAQGFTEFMAPFEHAITVVCHPEWPWGQVGVYGVSRYESDGTTLAEDLDTTETSIDVSTPTGPVWSFADGAFDVVIGGERITVGGITGAGASQTFTSCARSVNGVVKEHKTGAAVELFQPAVYAPT